MESSIFGVDLTKTTTLTVKYGGGDIYRCLMTQICKHKY